MKLLFIAASFFFFSTTFAQNGQMPGNNVQGIKIAYMTRQLKLSSDEAEKFWPVYYDYTDEMSDTRKLYKDNIVQLDEKVAAVRKKYYLEFKKTLGTDERANGVFLAERDFGAFIKKEMDERQRLRNAGKPGTR
ncbi:hypothetical protein ACI6Q2_01800 [Chitinophagaceae bacterium LWZ2-11]